MKNLQRGSIAVIAIISLAVVVSTVGIFYFKNKNSSKNETPVVQQEIDPLAEAKARADAERKVLALEQKIYLLEMLINNFN
jgi:negative regulator of sigma E activity